MNGVNIRIITVIYYTIECDGEDCIGILTGFSDLVATLFTYVLIYKKKNYKIFTNHVINWVLLFSALLL